MTFWQVPVHIYHVCPAVLITWNCWNNQIWKNLRLIRRVLMIKLLQLFIIGNVSETPCSHGSWLQTVHWICRQRQPPGKRTTTAVVRKVVWRLRNPCVRSVQISWVCMGRYFQKSQTQIQPLRWCSRNAVRTRACVIFFDLSLTFQHRF